MNSPYQNIELEFAQAQRARANGNEGQARVCARRATGIAIRDYYTRKALALPSRSAHDLLNHIMEEAPLPPNLKRVAHHLTLRVTEDFTLPVEADLIAEAKLLCEWLLKH